MSKKRRATKTKKATFPKTVYADKYGNWAANPHSSSNANIYFEDGEPIAQYELVNTGKVTTAVTFDK